MKGSQAAKALLSIHFSQKKYISTLLIMSDICTAHWQLDRKKENEKKTKNRKIIIIKMKE